MENTTIKVRDNIIFPFDIRSTLGVPCLGLKIQTFFQKMKNVIYLKTYWHHKINYKTTNRNVFVINWTKNLRPKNIVNYLFPNRKININFYK